MILSVQFDSLDLWNENWVAVSLTFHGYELLEIGLYCPSPRYSSVGDLLVEL